MTKNYVCLTLYLILYLMNHTSYDCFFFGTWVKWLYHQQFLFFIFSIFCFVLFFFVGGGGVHGDKKCKKSPIIYQFQSIACYISRIVDHIIKIVGTTNKKKTKFKQPVNCSVAEALTAWYKDKAMTSVISWLQAQSFLYENNCKLQVLQKAGIKIAACSIYSDPFFFYIVSLLLENKKLLWLQFSSAN